MLPPVLLVGNRIPKDGIEAALLLLRLCNAFVLSALLDCSGHSISAVSGDAL
jgi:hypothetical protein